MITLAMNPSLVQEARKLETFRLALEAELKLAGLDASNLLITSSVENMDWMNPTGQLEGSMQFVELSPYAFEVGSALPYAMRREFGFTGMTDSLGRYFSYDPGAFFLTNAANDDEGQIQTIYQQAVERALSVMAVGL